MKLRPLFISLCILHIFSFPDFAFGPTDSSLTIFDSNNNQITNILSLPSGQFSTNEESLDLPTGQMLLDQNHNYLGQQLLTLPRDPLLDDDLNNDLN
jgi:hypothetical protein